ncbi:hypothetical protein OSTOST_03911, partial [Ostertagia ostertagi]
YAEKAETDDFRTEASEDCNNAPHTHLSSSFSSESGAHKRKAAVPHRRDELVAQTAQSLIVPNGVLLDLESDAAANSASHASLLSHIDDSAMQCLDRLINGNLDEVFPFCDDHDNLSGFAAGMESSFHANQSSGNTYQQEGTGDLFSESAPPPLDVGPSHSPPPPEVVHSSKSRSIDEGEIISEESLHGRTERTASLGKIVTRSDDHEINTGREHSPVPRSDSRRSSLDSGRSRRDERKVADRLKDFSRNPPKSDHRSRKSTTDRAELKDAVIFESGNVPRVHTPSTTGSRLSRERTRGFSSLFEEGHSNPSSRDSSPHREKLSRKEEERRQIRFPFSHLSCPMAVAAVSTVCAFVFPKHWSAARKRKADSDRNGVPSPVGFPHFPRQQQQKFAPQKRPLPATSLDSYLGSPPQKSPDIRDGEATSSRGSGKKCKLDLSKMPDIINKLYGEK